MRHVQIAIPLFSLAALAAASCSHGAGATTGPVAYCSATRPIAVSIAVRDSVSGRALADSATGTAQAADAPEPLVRVDSLTMWGGDQLGTYAVTVDRTGYRTWTQSGVAVTQTGACGNPVTVSLVARLQPRLDAIGASAPARVPR